MVVVVPLLRGEITPDQMQGMGAALMVPVGYLVLIGAAGLVVAWMRGRAK